jgi:hypothetical protein
VEKRLSLAPAGNRNPIPGPSSLVALPIEKMTNQNRNSKSALSEREIQSRSLG